MTAETFARSSPEFAAEMADTLAAGGTRFGVKGLSLEGALGPDYLSGVYGKVRLGSAANLTGTAVIDFTNGTYRAVFKQTPGGYWNLHSMFPEPLP